MSLTTGGGLVDEADPGSQLASRPGMAAKDSPGTLARDLIRTARPRQWVKNGFVLLPTVFGGAFGIAALGRTAIATAAFCLASSGLYFVNDIADRDADRLHERKRHRPIAAGRLAVGPAVAVAVVLLAGSLLLGLAASLESDGLLLAYVVSTLAYSAWLKHVAILDVIVIAAGFVLRVGAGAAAAPVVPSEWLLLCSLFLALFLGFGKRYNELVLLGDDAQTHRPVLGEYTAASLHQFLNASMLGTLFSYCLYTFFSPQGQTHHGLVLTIPFAVYGVFRYTLLMETRSEGGQPEEVLLRDRPTQLAALLWIGVALVAIYGPRL
jgi:4-hydroxybenzoate polyprenyltransferase